MLRSLFSFDSAGKKIKKISKILFYIAAILEFFGGIILLLMGIDGSDDALFAGPVIAVLGPILSYLSCLLFYGFGEIVDNVVSINNKSAGTTDKNQDNAELPDL